MNIRNFVIIAHVDHGKSTLADRMLELTGTIEARRMRPQYLDQLELERERGITIKMAPVRMRYRPTTNDIQLTTGRKSSVVSRESPDSGYILNLIDTPGHSDFSYEVSRALAAVEGAILLVDATKGIQAQTISNFRAAKGAGLVVIGVVNKIDLAPPQLERTVASVAEFLGVPQREVFRISGKTGDGVKELLEAVVERVPPPKSQMSNVPPEARLAKGGNGQVFTRALVFDSLYDDHKGILAYVRFFEGEVRAGDEVALVGTGAKCKVKEVGYFAPEFKPAERLSQGEIGYVATGLKEPALLKIGDTLLGGEMSNVSARGGSAPGGKGQMSKLTLPGYREPRPVVFISFYPDAATKFEDLKKSLERLRLTDAALFVEADANEALGRGFKVGFLGQLHFEITSSRLAREFGLSFITSFPSIAYRVKEGGRWHEVKDPNDFPENPEAVLQPMIHAEILTPSEYLSAVVNLTQVFDLTVQETRNIGEHILVRGEMPLGELIRDFDDQLKSVSHGFASFSYEFSDDALADVCKLEVLVAGELVAALTRVVFEKDAEREARVSVERLKGLLPKQQFAQAVQARVGGRIVARETIPALRKDVTGYLYGGDRTRKMKLWRKQKRGKEKLERMARVSVPVEVFREILKK